MEKRQFRVYQNPKKCVYNRSELQILIKQNPKTLKGLQSREIGLYGTDKPSFGSLAKLLKKNKSLSLFDIHAQKCRFHGFQKIYLAVKNLQSLSKLMIYCPNNRFVIRKFYHSFIICTKSLKQLTSLHSNFYNSDKMVSSRKALHLQIPFRLLSEIELRLHLANWLTDLTWRSFSFHLPFLSSLKSLDITVNFRNGFTQKHALYLFSAFSKLSRLTSLDLTLSSCSSSDLPVLKVLFENLKSLSRFQDLSLHLDTCEIPESGDQSLLATCIALLNPSSFRSLKLEPYKDFCDSDLTQLLVAIQRFSAFEYLFLNLWKNEQVTSNGFSNFSKTVFQFPALKALSLEISSAVETGPFFEIISDWLKYLKKLVSLEIRTWSSNKVENLGVERLCSQLGHLSKLENLHLSLGFDSKLDEKCIESVAQALRNLTELKILYLKWQNDKKVTNKSYESLLESFGHLKSLRELSIEFPLYVNKEMLEALSASLKPLERLNTLGLCLPVNCKEEYGEYHLYDDEREIEENYDDDFVGLLESMKALTVIMITFDGFRFSTKSKRIAAKSLKSFYLES